MLSGAKKVSRSDEDKDIEKLVLEENPCRKVFHFYSKIALWFIINLGPLYLLGPLNAMTTYTDPRIIETEFQPTTFKLGSFVVFAAVFGTCFTTGMCLMLIGCFKDKESDPDDPDHDPEDPESVKAHRDADAEETGNMCISMYMLQLSLAAGVAVVIMLAYSWKNWEWPMFYFRYLFSFTFGWWLGLSIDAVQVLMVLATIIDGIVGMWSSFEECVKIKKKAVGK